MEPQFSDPQNQIRIRRGDRVFIVGTTGSGKTTLARYLLHPQKYIVILDPKWGWEFSRRSMPYGNGVISDDPQVIVKHDKPSPIVYRPHLHELKSGLAWFWDWIWWREQTIVYIDEVLMCVASSQQLPFGLARAIQQGRQRGIGVWTATQRPSRIPVPLLSESEHHFIFRLRNPVDQKRMADYSDYSVLLDPPREHDFWYYGDRDQTLFRSNIRELKIGRT